MAEVVLDASALLALLNGEPGADQVAVVLADAVISAVNVSEVVGKLVEAGMPEPAVREALETLSLDIISFDTEQAYQAGLLRPITRGVGLSLADRTCLALAKQLGLPALTADRTWERLGVVAQVRVIR